MIIEAKNNTQNSLSIAGLEVSSGQKILLLDRDLARIRENEKDFLNINNSSFIIYLNGKQLLPNEALNIIFNSSIKKFVPTISEDNNNPELMIVSFQDLATDVVYRKVIGFDYDFHVGGGKGWFRDFEIGDSVSLYVTNSEEIIVKTFVDSVHVPFDGYMEIISPFASKKISKDYKIVFEYKKTNLEKQTNLVVHLFLYK